MYTRPDFARELKAQLAHMFRRQSGSPLPEGSVVGVRLRKLVRGCVDGCRRDAQAGGKVRSSRVVRLDRSGEIKAAEECIRLRKPVIDTVDRRLRIADRRECPFRSG